MKKIIAIMAITVTLFSFFACKKKEEKQPVPQTPAQGPIMAPHAETPAPGMQGMDPHGAPPQQRMEFKVIVPDEVKEAWSAVKLVVNDKKTNKQQDVAAEIGKEVMIPDSNLIVKVGPFLPDFKMEANIITSFTNEPKNPAVGLIIYEDGKQIYPEPGKTWGWFWARKELQMMHMFQHERFEIALQEGIKK